MYGGLAWRGLVAAAVLGASAGCATDSPLGTDQSENELSGEYLADALLTSLQAAQFYESAKSAECEPVALEAGAISDCTVRFSEGIYMGDTKREHPVRVTIDDAAGHFSYWVGG